MNGYKTLNAFGIGKGKCGLVYHPLFSGHEEGFQSEPEEVRRGLKAIKQAFEGSKVRLKSIPGAIVREALGPYDVVVELEADTTEDITAILRHKIRPIHGITNTVTCIWF